MEQIAPPKREPMVSEPSSFAGKLEVPLHEIHDLGVKGHGMPVGIVQRQRYIVPANYDHSLRRMGKHFTKQIQGCAASVRFTMSHSFQLCRSPS